jgi:hypothetical protein
LIHELTIEVADHPIALELEGDAFLHSVREIYDCFLSDKSPEFHLRIYPDDKLMIYDESSVGLTFSNEEFRIVEDYLTGFANLRTNKGEIRINPIWFIPSLATFVRSLFTLILVLKDNGIALHAFAGFFGFAYGGTVSLSTLFNRSVFWDLRHGGNLRRYPVCGCTCRFPQSGGRRIHI